MLAERMYSVVSAILSNISFIIWTIDSEDKRSIANKGLANAYEGEIIVLALVVAAIWEHGLYVSSETVNMVI